MFALGLARVIPLLYWSFCIWEQVKVKHRNAARIMGKESFLAIMTSVLYNILSKLYCHSSPTRRRVTVILKHKSVKSPQILGNIVPNRITWRDLLPTHPPAPSLPEERGGHDEIGDGVSYSH